MPLLRHTLISASAGSGKTFQLVRRYLHLLVCGEKPSRIAAMTFTRKAAGEFVSRILRALSELAESPAAARKFLSELEPAPEGPVDFAAILREVLRELPRLRLGTLDSFFASVAASFPMELGLPVGSAVMSEEEARQASTEVIEHLLGRLYREEDKAAARTLLEAFKEATYGNEEKKVMTVLAHWLEEGHDLWHECEDALLWGRPEAIWPRHRHPQAAIWTARSSIHDALRDLVEAFPASKLSSKALDAWEAIQEEAGAHQPGRKPEDKLKGFLQRLAPLMDDLRTGSATFEFHRSKWEFTGPAATAALAFIATLTGLELLTRCRRTQGIRRVIDAYEADYARTVRGRGRLSFADLARLLVRAQGDGSWADDAAKAELWYRLDGRVDHWLFDEFQDTSAQQWSIVRGLVGEVLQDVEQRRTFFAVGDVKQSIYLWRKAEARLFAQVLHDYPDKGTSGIAKTTLSKSYRSCQEVLDLVNGVYLNFAALRGLLGEGSLRHWEYKKHESACPEPRGVGAFVQVAEIEGEEEQPTAWELTAALLREIQPARRGLTCAVLVRSNGQATDMTGLLRELTGQDIVSQSEELPAADNPPCAALLALLELAAHPGDTLALEHLRMTPLAPIFTGGSWRGRLNKTLGILHHEGFATALEHWQPDLPSDLDEFSRRRVQRLIEIAAEFDESGSRDVDAFLQFARGYGARTGGAHLAVQVMTVHKSKGLEFDVVIVPLLEKEGMKTVEPGMEMQREGLHPAEWVLQFPPRPYDELDDVLAARRQRMEEDSAFESLCRYYVAMTRAKRGLYLVASRPPGASKVVNIGRLMRETLVQTEPVSGSIDGLPVEWLRVHGRTDWFARIPVLEPAEPAPAAAPPPQRLVDLLRLHQPMAKRRTPSGEESFAIKGSVLFSPGRETGRNLGTLVHALMEQVGWIDDRFNEAGLLAAWETKGFTSDAAFPVASEQALNVIRSAACRTAFTPPSPISRLWRERPFDLVQGNGEWISGTVDRVNITCDAAGRPVAAAIIDFKTDDVPDEEALKDKLDGYRPQIALYRQAVARLTGLEAKKISASLLFTRLGRLASL